MFRSWGWIGDEERVGPQHVYQTVQHARGLVMIWGCMTAFGLGAWYIIEDTMDRQIVQIHSNLFLCGPLQRITIWFHVG